MKLECALCRAFPVELYFERSYDQAAFFICNQCSFVFLDPQKRLGVEAEKTRYELHKNTDIEGYRKFLFKLVNFLTPHLRVGMRGLDYGCGPSPLMEKLFREMGFFMNSYDPFFQPQELVPETYDFITCSEVAEHFYDPAAEFCRIFSLLKPGGFLAVMTNFLPEKNVFANWHYHRDPTHVGFFSVKSFLWVKKKFAAHSFIQEPLLVIFQK